MFETYARKLWDCFCKLGGEDVLRMRCYYFYKKNSRMLSYITVWVFSPSQDGMETHFKEIIRYIEESAWS